MARSKTNHPVPIVGIGASAGGVEALGGFFRGLDAKPGLGFVIVTHLSPDRESMMHEIVARYTKMKVYVAADGAQVATNTVHVLPPDAVISIAEGRLQVHRLGANGGRSTSFSARWPRTAANTAQA
jgi:two-component system, chemotaxis family, CheB/CheR fusion protein